ncbi:hypothetical protein D3C72_1904780 [compost metagenome]
MLDGCYGFHDGRVVGDIGGIGAGLAAALGDQVHGGLGRCGIAVEYGHQAPFNRKALAHRAADAAAAARDDHGFSIKTFHVAVLSCQGLGVRCASSSPGEFPVPARAA